MRPDIRAPCERPALAIFPDGKQRISATAIRHGHQHAAFRTVPCNDLVQAQNWRPWDRHRLQNGVFAVHHFRVEPFGSLQAVLVGLSCDVDHTCAFETHEYDYPDPDDVRRLGNATIRRFRKHLGKDGRDRLIGVGISAPYFIGSWDGELGFPADVRDGWRAINLASNFLETDGLPVLVENDSSAAAVAELIHGEGRRYGDFLHISISTFVGAGLIIDGTLQTGPNGNTAAFGPFPVTHSALSSVPKPKGKFEVLLHRASIYTLVNHLRAGGVAIHRVRELDPMPVEAASLVSEWQDDCADALAQAIIGTIAIVDIQAVFVDGLLPQPLLADTVSRLRSRFADMMPSGLIAPEIMPGSLGAKASAVGASLLPIYSMFGPDAGVLTRKGTDRKPLMVGSMN